MSEFGYGYFPGGDPRNFTPDRECCSPGEIEAWERDCAAWEKGEQIHSVKFGREYSRDGKSSIHFSGYGIGTYTLEGLNALG